MISTNDLVLLLMRRLGPGDQYNMAERAKMCDLDLGVNDASLAISELLSEGLIVRGKLVSLHCYALSGRGREQADKQAKELFEKVSRLVGTPDGG